VAEEPQDDSIGRGEQEDTPPPPSPLPLDYKRLEAGPYQTKTPLGVQVLAGFVAWIIGLGFVVMAANNRTWNSPFLDSQNATYAAIAFALVGTGSLAIWLRVRYRWRGFLPGLLIGFALSCLLPLGILLIICGNGKI